MHMCLRPQLALYGTEHQFPSNGAEADARRGTRGAWLVGAQGYGEIHDIIYFKLTSEAVALFTRPIYSKLC